jgi:hypothetical protein
MTRAVLPSFWTLPTAFLSGASAAAGIAVLNPFGNLAEFFDPFVMAWLTDRTADYAVGLCVIAAYAVVAMAVVLVLPHNRTLVDVPARDDNAIRAQRDRDCRVAALLAMTARVWAFADCNDCAGRNDRVGIQQIPILINVARRCSVGRHSAASDGATSPGFGNVEGSSPGIA